MFSLLVLRLFLHLDLFDVFFLGGCFLPPSTISKHHLFALLGGPFPVKPLLFPAHQVFFLILLFFLLLLLLQSSWLLSPQLFLKCSLHFCFQSVQKWSNLLQSGLRFAFLEIALDVLDYFIFTEASS